MEATCIVCGRTFEARRRTARYCSRAHAKRGERAGLTYITDPDLLEAWRHSEAVARRIEEEISDLDAALDAEHERITREVPVEDRDAALTKATESYWRRRLALDPLP